MRWPRSRDLPRELPSLMAVLDPLWGRITRVAVNPEHWPVVPRKVQVDGHIVKVGWFTPEIDPHKLLLLSYGVGRWDLLVIPRDRHGVGDPPDDGRLPPRRPAADRERAHHRRPGPPHRPRRTRGPRGRPPAAEPPRRRNVRRAVASIPPSPPTCSSPERHTRSADSTPSTPQGSPCAHTAASRPAADAVTARPHPPRGRTSPGRRAPSNDTTIATEAAAASRRAVAEAGPRTTSAERTVSGRGGFLLPGLRKICHDESRHWISMALGFLL